jgi:hypothetical protein
MESRRNQYPDGRSPSARLVSDERSLQVRIRFRRINLFLRIAEPTMFPPDVLPMVPAGNPTLAVRRSLARWRPCGFCCLPRRRDADYDDQWPRKSRWNAHRAEPGGSVQQASMPPGPPGSHDGVRVTPDGGPLGIEPVKFGDRPYAVVAGDNHETWATLGDGGRRIFLVADTNASAILYPTPLQPVLLSTIWAWQREASGLPLPPPKEPKPCCSRE